MDKARLKLAMKLWLLSTEGELSWLSVLVNRLVSFIAVLWLLVEGYSWSWLVVFVYAITLVIPFYRAWQRAALPEVVSRYKDAYKSYF